MRDELQFVLRAARELPAEQLPRLLGELEEVRCTARRVRRQAPQDAEDWAAEVSEPEAAWGKLVVDQVMD